MIVLIAALCVHAQSSEAPTIELEFDEPTAVEDTIGADSVPPLTRQPALTAFVQAEYPPALVKQGIEGSVLMDLLVSDSGTVDSVAIARSLNPALDTAAMRAARKFRFLPAMADTHTVAVLLQYEYRFSLNEVVEKLDKYVNFSGHLFERGTRKPLADAMVVLNFIDTTSDTSLAVPFWSHIKRIGAFEGQYLEENRLVTLTDSTGFFHFWSLPACSVQINVPLSGYEDFREKELVAPSTETQVTYYIQRLSYSDYEIVVYGKREEKEVTRRQLTLTEVKKIPGLGGDAVKVVQALPGVGRPTFGSGQIVVRGAPTWDSRFFLDGVSIPLLYHFGGLKSTYNSDALDKVDFYPGGWGTRYGGGTAGVIELTGRKAKKDRWQGFVDPNLNDGSFMIEGPVTPKVSVLASARMSFSGFLLSWAMNNMNLNLPYTLQPYYWDYLARTDIDISKNSHAFVTVFGSGDRFKLIYPSMAGGSKEVDEATDAAKMRTTFHIGLAGWDWTLSPMVKNSLRASFTYENAMFSLFGIVKSTQEPYMYYVRDQLTWDLRKTLRLNLGADVSLMDENLTIIMPDATGKIVRDVTNNWWFGVVGGYLNLEWKPIERLQIIPGLRYDFYPELDYQGAVIPEFTDYHFKNFDNTCRFSGEPSVRVNGRYEIAKNHTIKAAIGNYSQTPQPMGQVIHPRWGAPHMPATRAAHYVLGYEWQITDLISADIQGYYNKQWNIPRMASTGVDVATGKLWFPDEQSRMFGLELMLRHDQGKRFFGWIAYSLAHSERYNPREDRWYLYGQDVPNNLQVIGSWRLRRNIEVGFRARYVTGKPETPVVDATYQENYHYYKPVYGKTNSTRVKPFAQLDARIDKKFIFRKSMLSIYLDLQNLSYFVYKSPEMYFYNYDYTERTEIPAGIFLPAFGFRLEF
jgi:TonB family protein